MLYQHNPVNLFQDADVYCWQNAIRSMSFRKQMYFILDRIEQVIVKLGVALNDVVRTRIYVNHVDDWEMVAKIHGNKFRKIRPVNTLIQAKLAGECLVEVEAEAIIQSDLNSPTDSA